MIKYIDNITKKIDLIIKKFTKKKKIFLENELSVIDFLTGKKVEKFSPNSYVINLKKVFQKITEAKHKLNFPYVYRKKDGKYIGANVLSLSLIYEALKDYFNDTIFVLSNEKAKIALLIYDLENYKIVEKNEDFEIIKQDFFQGFTPKYVDIYDAIHLVTQKNIKKIFYFTLAGVAIILAIKIIVSVNIEETDDFYIPPAKKITEKNKNKITQREFEKKIPYTTAKILATNYFITKLFHNKYKDDLSVILKKIMYKQYSVKFISFLPKEGFKFNGMFYEKIQKFSPPLEILWAMYKQNAINKDPLECEQIIKEETKKISYIDEKGEYKIFKLKKDMKPDEFSKFLTQLYGCPIVLDGITDYELFDNKVKNNLNIRIYYN